MIPAPQPYPDELISSALFRCCRWFGLSLNDLYRQLLGRAKLCQFLAIGHLQEVATLFHLPAERLLWEHTIFPYATAFLPAKAYGNARRSALASEFSGLSNLWRSAAAGPRVRRMCESCVKQDRRRYGESYWHRAHNLPGVFMCAIHKTPLQFTDMPTVRWTKRSYSMPLECSPLAPPIAPSKALLRLATLSARLLTRTPGPGQQRTGATYRELAMQRGLLSDTRFLDWTAVSQLLLREFQPNFLSICDELPENAPRWPGRAISVGNFHAKLSPLRHLMLQIALTPPRRSITTSLDHQPNRGHRVTDAELDQLLASRADAELQIVLRDGLKLSTKAFLDRFGANAAYIWRGPRLPMLRAAIGRFRVSNATLRQLLRPSVTYRNRTE